MTNVAIEDYMSEHILLLKSKEKVKTPRTKPNPKTFAQCRISLEEYESSQGLSS